jgi:ADP-heptose:LPS heptosyltransferase
VVHRTVTEDMNQLPGARARRRVRALFNWRPLRRPTRALEDPTLMPWRLIITRLPSRIVAQLLMPRFGRRIGTGPRSIDEVRHVAVIHWDSLGDAVLLGPVLRELRRTLPAARIVLVYNEKNHGVFENCPYVDILRPQTVQRPSDGSSPHGAPISHWRRVRGAARILAEEARSQGKIDLVIGPDWLDTVYGSTFFDSALSRAGNSRRFLKTSGFKPYEVEIRQHFVLRNLGILAVLGIHVENDHLEFWASDQDREIGRTLLAEVSSAPLRIAIAPGASESRRRWPAERFIQVVDEILTQRDVRFVLVGGDDVRPIVDAISPVDNEKIVDLVGFTTVGSLAVVLGGVDLLITNDSGPAHVAASVGTPTLVVSAHPVDADPWVVGSPNRYRPWGVPSVVLQPANRLPPCDRETTCRASMPHCILSVSVEDVVPAALEMLESAAETGT